MEKVSKNGLTFGVKDKNQRAAFINAGWKLVETGEIASPVSQSAETDKSGQDDREPHKYSKSEITRMSTADLKKLGAELGIANAETSTGEALKSMIIEKLDL